MSRADLAVRPYKMLNASERAMLTARLGKGVDTWTEEHLAGSDPAVCTLVSAQEAAAALAEEREWMLGSRLPSGEVVAIGLAGEWPRDLARLVLTGRSALSLDPAGLALMRTVGARLVEGLAHAVLAACLPGQSFEGRLSWTRLETPRINIGAGSGHCLVRCQLGDSASLLILLWPATVLECVGPPPLSKDVQAAVESRSRAIRSEVVVLDAVAGEAELAVEDVTTLAVGDVLKLDRALSEPLQVRVRGGGQVCSARLGALRGRAALQLI